MIFVIFLGRVLFVSMDTSLLRMILKIRSMESLKQNRKHTVHFTFPSKMDFIFGEDWIFVVLQTTN